MPTTGTVYPAPTLPPWHLTHLAPERPEPPRLLCLPFELRGMIWKFVLGHEPFLLHAVPHGWAQPRGVTAAHATILAPSYLEATCNSLHRHPAHGRYRRLARTKRPAHATCRGALSWLRTCRLIYIEVIALLANNLSLHVYDHVTLAAALEQTPSFPVSEVLSLTFCVRIRVEWDYSDSFKPKRLIIQDPNIENKEYFR